MEINPKVKKLFEPLWIGKMELKNRICLAAMVPVFATKDGVVTDRTKNYYANIARGGTALIVTEAAYISREGQRVKNQMGAYGDKLIPGLKDLAHAVHENGAKIALQLHHGGRECSSEVTGMTPVAPTNLASAFRAITKDQELPRQLTIQEIKELIEKFGDGARRAREAGFDAVEIHGAHGYIVNQFLSPLSNKRTDKYGGDVEGRTTFLVEIIKDIKKKCGDGFPVITKINVNDYVQGGITPEDAKVTAHLIEAAGGDAIVASVGLHSSRPYMMIPPMSIAPFTNVPYSAEIKKLVKIPVAAIGRIIEPIKAAQIIEEGKADYLVMGRALLSDPEFANKAAEGRFDDIRECIGCNQGCIDHTHHFIPFTCLQNPVIGREKEFEIVKAGKPKKVLVIGGGPAGLEAARVAALRNHKVVLCEKDTELGGQIRVGKLPPNRQELGKVTDYLIRQIKKLGVEVKTGTAATVATVKQMKPDAIIVATGANPLMPKIRGINNDNVFCAVDVLKGQAQVGQKVVVVGGGLVGLETTDFLVEKGKEVIILEMLDNVAEDMGNANRIYFEEKFANATVEIKLNAKVEEISRDGVTYVQKQWMKQIMGVDTVVLATGATTNNKLYEELKGRFANVYAVGDCVKPRNALESIYEGSRVAREI